MKHIDFAFFVQRSGVTGERAGEASAWRATGTSLANLLKLLPQHLQVEIPHVSDFCDLGAVPELQPVLDTSGSSRPSGLIKIIKHG